MPTPTIEELLSEMAQECMTSMAKELFTPEGDPLPGMSDAAAGAVARDVVRAYVNNVGILLHHGVETGLAILADKAGIEVPDSMLPDPGEEVTWN